MNYFAQLFNLMIEVMLPLSLLAAAGALWPVFFRDAPLAAMRTQLNRLVMYLFYPSITFAVAATTPVNLSLLSVPLLIGWSTILFWLSLPALMAFGPIR